jgi:hypothetical protein
VPVPEIYKKIEIAKLASDNAGPSATLNAVLDVLKEIAQHLEASEKPATQGLSPQPPAIAIAPETRGRKFRFDE